MIVGGSIWTGKSRIAKWVPEIETVIDGANATSFFLERQTKSPHLSESSQTLKLAVES